MVGGVGNQQEITQEVKDLTNSLKASIGTPRAAPTAATRR